MAAFVLREDLYKLELKQKKLRDRLKHQRLKHELGHRYGPVFLPEERVCQNRGSGSVYIFRADCMEYTPFSASEPIHEALAAGGITFVDTPGDANIILARKEKELQLYGSHNADFAIWTHEPRYNNRVETPTRIPGIRNAVHIMNAYTGKIYTDNFYYFQRREVDYDSMMRIFAHKPRRAVILASYASPPTDVLLDGRDIDLYQSRQWLALRLVEYGFCDVYGRNWPKNIKIAGTKRKGAWGKEKGAVLGHYKINICFENTIVPHYVSEKLWDAIVGACLPVYHGSDNGIYETFPRNSFVEANGKSIEALAREVISMSPEEMETRYAACLRAYVDAAKQDRRKLSRDACVVRTVRFLHSILNYPVAARQ